MGVNYFIIFCYFNLNLFFFDLDGTTSFFLECNFLKFLKRSKYGQTGKTFFIFLNEKILFIILKKNRKWRQWF